jgi:hypothetical protein
MVFNGLYNVTYNYTLIITSSGVSSLFFYPLLYVFLILLPFIVLIIVAGFRFSNRTRSVILLLNTIYSLLLPLIAMSILGYFQLETYLFNMTLYDYTLFTIFNTLYSIVLAIYQNIYQISIGLALLNIVLIFYYYVTPSY